MSNITLQETGTSNQLSNRWFVAYRGRIIAKRINVRIEHVKHSNCRLDFLRRVEENEKKKMEAKAKGETVNCKRIVSIMYPFIGNALFVLMQLIFVLQ